MKNAWMKLALVAALCALCAWELGVKGIRLGKDLQGGVSLVYSVKVPSDQPSEQVLGQVIEVLKQRVNPQGVLDIAIAGHSMGGLIATNYIRKLRQDNTPIPFAGVFLNGPWYALFESHFSQVCFSFSNFHNKHCFRIGYLLNKIQLTVGKTNF